MNASGEVARVVRCLLPTLTICSVSTQRRPVGERRETCVLEEYSEALYDDSWLNMKEMFVIKLIILGRSVDIFATIGPTTRYSTEFGEELTRAVNTRSLIFYSGCNLIRFRFRIL